MVMIDFFFFYKNGDHGLKTLSPIAVEFGQKKMKIHRRKLLFKSRRKGIGVKTPQKHMKTMRGHGLPKGVESRDFYNSHCATPPPPTCPTLPHGIRPIILERQIYPQSE